MQLEIDGQSVTKAGELPWLVSVVFSCTTVSFCDAHSRVTCSERNGVEDGILLIVASGSGALPDPGTGPSSAVFGFVHGSSFQLVCSDTFSHSPCNCASTSSLPLTRNHHRLRPDVSLNFFFTDSWLPKVVSLFKTEDTAAGGVFLRVPQILLTPVTGILSP